MVTVWWSAASLIHYSFLNPIKTITSEKYAQQIDEKHWKLQCLQPALVNRKGPILLHNQCLTTYCTTNTSKVKRVGLRSFASFAIFTWPLANWLLLLQASWQHFSGKTPPQPAGGRKWTLSKSSLNSEASTFMLQEWMSLLPVGKNVSTVIVPILSNKDVFEHSYNYLKFMAGTNITFVPT